MKCPNCKNEISILSKYCDYCGQAIKKNKMAKSYEYNSCITYNELIKPRTPNSHLSQYNYSKNYSNVKNNANLTHQQQYNYNVQYSNVQKNTNISHEQQYNYSNQYSKVPQQEKNEHQDQYEYSSKYSNKNNKELISEEYYIKAYVGENYEKLVNSKYSIPTLLFGGFYFFYRKLWIYAIIWTIIAIIFNFAFTILLIVNAILATKFKELYLHQVDKNIQFIKNNNPDKSSTEIIELCKKQGEPIKKISPPFIIIIFIFIISIITINIENEYDNLDIGTDEELYETNENHYNYFNDEIKNKTFSINNMDYTINTNEFSEVVSTDNFRQYQTNDKSCTFTIRNFPYNQTYLDNYKYASNKIINNYTWKQIYDDYKYFITTHENSFYEVKVISEDIDCRVKINKIMETTSFKNTQYYNNGV